MTKALADAWADIRKHQPAVPRVDWAVIPGKSGSRCGSVSWGHSPVLLVDELMLDRQPLDIMEWLLHQAAHGVADTTEGPTQASEGRYHDRGYRDVAEGLGLEATAARGLGWADTEMTPATVARYQKAVERLGEAQGGSRPHSPAREAQARKPPNRGRLPVQCQCQPPRRIQVTGSTFGLGEISCGVCGKPFRVAVIRGV